MKYRTLEIKTAWNADPKQGGLSFVEGERDIPFPIDRIYCIHKSDENVFREISDGREDPMLLFCPFGTVDIVLSDGEHTKSLPLDNPAKGLVLDPDGAVEIVWHNENAVLCVVAGRKKSAVPSVPRPIPQPHPGKAGNVHDCKMLRLPFLTPVSEPSAGTSTNPGSVTLESLKNVPFPIKRIFYIFGQGNVGQVRGKHANRKSEFVLFNISGRSKVKVIDEDLHEMVYALNEPRDAVYLPTMIWKEMYDFTPDSVMMVVTNAYYDSGEYVRDFDAFAEEIRGMKKNPENTMEQQLLGEEKSGSTICSFEKNL